MIFSLILLSVTLSIDALFLGLAFGANKKKIPISSKVAICLCSVFYSGVALFAGSYILQIMPPFIAKLIGAVLLFIIGMSFIIKSFLKEKENKIIKVVQKERKPIKIVIKSIAITIQILKNPDSADIDNSGIVDIKEALFIGTALSVDSIGVGIGSAMSGLHGWYIALFIGLFQMVFLNVGQHLSCYLSFISNNRKLSGIIPGLLLIALSILRIFV